MTFAKKFIYKFKDLEYGIKSRILYYIFRNAEHFLIHIKAEPGSVSNLLKKHKVDISYFIHIICKTTINFLSMFNVIKGGK